MKTRGTRVYPIVNKFYYKFEQYSNMGRVDTEDEENWKLPL